MGKKRDDDISVVNFYPYSNYTKDGFNTNFTRIAINDEKK